MEEASGLVRQADDSVRSINPGASGSPLRQFSNTGGKRASSCVDLTEDAHGGLVRLWLPGVDHISS